MDELKMVGQAESLVGRPVLALAEGEIFLWPCQACGHKHGEIGKMKFGKHAQTFIRCPACGHQVKPTGGHRSWERVTADWQSHVVPMKQCASCGQKKPKTHFYSKSGKCKICYRIHKQPYLDRTAQRRQEYFRLRREVFRNQILAQNRKWRMAHRKQIAEYSRKYRKQHIEKIREYMRRSYQKHRQERCAHQRRVYAQKKGKDFS